MARRSGAATRYAEAIFDVAREASTFEAWEAELAEVAEVVANPAAAQVLTSPAIPRAQKSAILAEALPGLSDPMKRFLALLLQRDRLGVAPEVLTGFRRLVNEHRGIQTAEVASAFPLDDEQRRGLERRLAAEFGSRVRLDEQVDPSLIGGIVARVGDRVIDGSVRGCLERLRRVLARPA